MPSVPTLMCGPPDHPDMDEGDADCQSPPHSAAAFIPDRRRRRLGQQHVACKKGRAGGGEKRTANDRQRGTEDERGTASLRLFLACRAICNVAFTIIFYIT